VLRQIEYASKEYDIDVIGYGKWTPQWPNVGFQEVEKRIPQQRMKLLQLVIFLLGGWIAPRLWMKAYWWRPDYRDALKILRKKGYSIIHANDLEAVPVAIVAAEENGAKVLFDAHEYAPGQAKYSIGRSKFIYFGYVRHLLRSFGLRANAFITVSEGIAKLYRKRFNLSAEIIMNAPARADVNFRPVDPCHIRLIHHGRAKRKRQLEQLVETIGLLSNRFSLYFMLIAEQDRYIQDLKQLAERVAPGRVFFRAPVKPSEIVKSLTDFDIGIYSLPPIVTNNKFALPNKLFDFFAAGLAVVVGPSPEMARLVSEYGFGIVADGFEAEDLGIALNNLTAEDLNKMKINALDASRLLNAEVEMAKLMEIYRKLLE
jgi:glycosyltransferase involved in cell wall biosynthesis